MYAMPYIYVLMSEIKGTHSVQKYNSVFSTKV